ncbi:MAG: hypothetical protein V3W20_06780 [Candidatus Neomarinimicrobiota bacterium]
MIPKATILYSDQLDVVDRNLSKLIKFMGLECEELSVEQFIANQDLLLSEKNLCLLSSKETMVNLMRVFKKNNNSMLALMNKLHSMFIYNFDPSQSSCHVLKLLTEDVVSSISQFEHNNYQYKISDHYKDICGPFTGLSFGPIKRNIDFGFNVECDGDNIVPLISIGERGVYLTIIILRSAS